MLRKSIWKDDEAGNGAIAATPLPNDKKDVIIIGGGLAGMLCAYNLLKKGVVKVCVIEQHTIGSGTTGNTTAKITAQHGLIYDKIGTALGREMSYQYAVSNLRAVDAYEKIVSTYDIDCEFKRQDAYLYTLDERGVDRLEQEVLSANLLGINAFLESTCDIPLPVKSAVRFTNQAQFHPLKFLNALSDIIINMGGEILEHTKVLAVESNSAITSGGTLKADKIVICTRFPLLSKKGLYFIKLYQSRSYVLALKNALSTNSKDHDDPFKTFRGMFRDANEDGLSFRSVHHDVHGHLLLLGGEAHKTGHKGKTDHYKELEKIAAELYPHSTIVAEWSAQDCMTHDNIPYIGLHNKKNPDLYIATGFNKWGMTSSMVSAEIISDLITLGRSENEDVFSRGRQSGSLQAGSFIKEFADTGANLALGLLTPRKKYYPRHKKKTGRSYKKGVRARCRHMGSALHWNENERSWDCPAHGSRYDEEGHVLENPAASSLKPINGE